MASVIAIDGGNMRVETDRLDRFQFNRNDDVDDNIIISQQQHETQFVHGMLFGWLIESHKIGSHWN